MQLSNRIMEPITKFLTQVIPSMISNKKIKKQKKTAGVWTANNYSKLAQLYTREIVQNVLLKIADLPSKLGHLFTVPEGSADTKFLFVLLEDIDGATLEAALKDMKSEQIQQILAGQNAVRCKSTWLKKEVKANVWDDILDFDLSKANDSVPQTATPDGAAEIIFKATKSLRAKIFEGIDDDDLNTNQNNLSSEMHELYQNATLSEFEMAKYAFPTSQAEYKSTANWHSEDVKYHPVLAIDCEMVTTTAGTELAHIVVIDSDFKTLVNRYVKPKNEITDYLTVFSGISQYTYQENDFVDLEAVQNELSTLMNKNTILIGHGLENDLHALQIVHDKCVDTSVLFQRQTHFKTSLKTLVYEHFGAKIQTDAHNPTEDARAALALAKLKIETLDKYLPHMVAKNWSVDFLNLLHSKFSAAVVDFEFNCKKLLNSDANYETTTRNDEILKTTLKFVESALNAPYFSRLVLARFMLNRNHEYQAKLENLKAFLERICLLQAEMKLGFCLATTIYRKNEVDRMFNYDLLIMS